MKTLCLAMALALVPVAAFASDEPSVMACELAVETIIVTPASYQRFHAETVGHSVIIDFDSQGAAGAPKRSRAECQFEKTQAGRWRLSGISVDGDKTVYGGKSDVVGDVLDNAGLAEFDGGGLGD